MMYRIKRFSSENEENGGGNLSNLALGGSGLLATGAVLKGISKMNNEK